MTRLRDLDLSLPPRWRRRSDPDRGVLLQARPPGVPLSGTRPELVLRCTVVDDGQDLAAWRATALADLGTRLSGFDLEDQGAYDLGGRPVVRARFAHRDGAAELVSEQWSWLLGRTGLTLTGTVARADHADYREVFEAVASTLEPHSRAA